MIHFAYLIRFEDPQMHYTEKMRSEKVVFILNKISVRFALLLFRNTGSIINYMKLVIIVIILSIKYVKIYIVI